MNDLQKKLYDHWLWVKDSVVQKPHVLCLNGDLTDGPNHRQLGQQSWSANMNDQVNDAARLLKTYSPKYFVMTRGSTYHVQGGATSYEEFLADKLNCVPYDDFMLDSNGNQVPTRGIEAINDAHNHKTRTDYYLTLKIHDRTFSVTHHVGFNRMNAYRTTALAAELANLKFLEGRYWDRENFPSIVVRSHVHYFVQIAFSDTYAFTNGCFKFPDAYLFKAGLAGTAPSIGAVEVIVEPNNKVIIEPHIVKDSDYPKHAILDLTD